MYRKISWEIFGFGGLYHFIFHKNLLLFKGPVLMEMVLGKHNFCRVIICTSAYGSIMFGWS